MIGLQCAVSTPVRATGWRRLTGALLWIVFIGCLPTGCAATDSVESNSEKISVTPMVRLQPGVTEQRVTGKIAKNEWKKETLPDQSICWAGDLLTFKVYHSVFAGGPPKCVKKGVPIPPSVSRDSNFVINAICPAGERYPAVRVRICQPNRPGDLHFDFRSTNVPEEGTTLTIKAEHFKVADRPATSLSAVLDTSQAATFYLNDPESADTVTAVHAGGPRPDRNLSWIAHSTSSTGDDTLDVFLPLLGNSLFVETYAKEGAVLPSGRGVIWPNPSISLDWADVTTITPSHVRIHTKLGVMECMPSGGAWNKLELSDCFRIAKLSADTGEHYLFLTWQRSSTDSVAVIKAYRGDERERTIRVPRMQGDSWKIADLIVAPSNLESSPASGGAVATHTLADFTGIPTDATVAFTAPEQTVLWVRDNDTEASHTLAFDTTDKEKSLRLGAGRYEMRAYREGHNLYRDFFRVEAVGGAPFRYDIIHNDTRYDPGVLFHIVPQPTEYTEKRTPITLNDARQKFARQYGIEDTNGLYVRFASRQDAHRKFDIPITAKLYSSTALTGYAFHYVHDEKERYAFREQGNVRDPLPLYTSLLPSSVKVTLTLDNTDEVGSVEWRYQDEHEWHKLEKLSDQWRAFLQLTPPPSSHVSPATKPINLRACATRLSTPYTGLLQAQSVSQVLGDPVTPSPWVPTPLPEHTLVFLSGDSRTVEAKLKTDGQRFFNAAFDVIREHQKTRHGNNRATVLYGAGMDGQFQQYIFGNPVVPPTDMGGTQNLDQELNNALHNLRDTAKTGVGRHHPCGIGNFRLIYFGDALSMTASKVPDAFTSVDVVTPVQASAEHIPLGLRFKEHLVDSTQNINDQLNALLPTERR